MWALDTAELMRYSDARELGRLSHPTTQGTISSLFALMSWHNRPMADQFAKSQSAMVNVRLKNKVHVAINGVPIYYRPAGFVMEVPDLNAEIMMRNGSAELFTEALFAFIRQETSW
jgi:hypothetical protein